MTKSRHVTLIFMRTTSLFARRWCRAFLTLLSACALITSGTSAQALDFGPSSNYLIRVTPEAKAVIEKTLTQYGGRIDARYQYVFDGFLVKLPDIAVTALRKIPTILIIEKDAPVDMSAIQNYQSPAPSWGLDRIDQRERANTNSSYGYRSAGSGSTVYVLDTGVLAHNDLLGRLSTSGYSSISDGNGTTDCNGHGTHVSATIAGTQYGVAKNATIVPVRVLGCNGSGTYSQVISGMEWILSPANPNSKSQAVANMSLGGASSIALDAAVTKLTNSGITTVVAAGNSNADACNFSPARAPSAITVGSIEKTDAKSSFSNWGPCVDIHAPGGAITSAWIGSPTDARIIGGTSMASPHVAGAAAIYLGLNPSASVAQVTQFIDSQATVGAITGLPVGTVNELLYVSPTDNAPPIVPPTVALRSVGNITHEAAEITIDVNPGFAPTNIGMQYSTDSTMTTGLLTATITPSQVSGGNMVQATLKLTGLTPSKTYYFRMIGTNESGVTTSSIGNFKTLAPPKILPKVTLVPPTSITAYSAALQGSVTPGNDETSVSFMYGTDPTFKVNSKTGLSIPAMVNGGNPVAVSLPISFLEGGLVYYVKLIASNSTGTVSSETISFDTPKAPGKAPSIAIKQNGYMFSTSKENPIGGVLNPQGQTTVVSLVYGTDSSLTVGNKVLNVGSFSGDSDIAITATLPPLSPPGARIFFRFDAANASGVTKTTSSSFVVEPLAPFITVQRATSTKAGQATLTAVGDAQGSNTRWSFIYGKSANLYTVSSTGVVTLAPEAIEVKGNPEARVTAGSFTTTAALVGLDSATTYYFVVRVNSLGYADPAAGRPIFSTPMSWTTLNASPTPSPTATPTPSVSPKPTNSPTPTPSPTTSPSPVKQSQTINFPPLANRFYTDAGTSLLAKASSNLAISYTTTTPTLCQILSLGSGQFSVVPRYPLTSADSSTCAVIANQVGNDSFLSASAVTQTITFNSQSTRINITAPPSVPETGAFLLANVTPTEGRAVTLTKGISFISTTPLICTVSEYSEEDSRGARVTVRARTNGVCSVSLSYSGSTEYKASTSSWNTTISGLKTPAPGSNTSQTIDFPTLVDRNIGRSQPLLAKATSGLQITYISMTPNICLILYPSTGPSVQSQPSVPDANSWTCTIRATQIGDDRYAPAVSVDRTFTYTKIPMVIRVQNYPTLSGPNSQSLISYVRFADDSQMSGLTSLGHLLTVTSLTPNICRVDSNALKDLTGGIVNQTMVTVLTSGACSLKFDFAGTKDRAPTNLIWNATATR